MQLLEDFVRWIVWIICQVAFWIVDNVYTLLDQIATFEIFEFNNGIVLEIWNGLLVFLTFAIAAFAIPIFINLMLNPQKISSTELAKKVIFVVCIAFVIRFLPLAIETIGEASNYAISRMNYILEVPADFTPSSMIVSAGNAAQNDDGGGYYTSEGEYVDGITHITVDEINERGINTGTSGVSDIWILGSIWDFATGVVGAKSYHYFPNTLYLFITLFVGSYACILFLIIAFDIAKRWFEVMMLLFVSPIPIASLIKDGSLFATWFKMIINIFISNYFEFFFALFAVYSIQGLAKYGFFMQIIMMFALLMVSLSGSNKISQLLGIETSGNSLQELANMSMIGRGIGGVLSGGYGVVKKFARGLGDSVSLGGGLALGGIGSHDYGRENISYSKTEPTRKEPAGTSGSASSEGSDFDAISNTSNANLNNDLASINDNIDSSNSMANRSGEDWKVDDSSQATYEGPYSIDGSEFDNKTTTYAEDKPLWKKGSPMARFQNFINKSADGIDASARNDMAKAESASEELSTRYASGIADRRNTKDLKRQISQSRRKSFIKRNIYSPMTRKVNRSIDSIYKGALQRKQNKISRKGYY